MRNVPFVETGDAHGHTLPPEAHSALDGGFSAHVEGPGSRETAAEPFDHGCVDSGTDQNLRSVNRILQLQQLADQVRAGSAAGCGTAGQYGIKAEPAGSEVGFCRIPGYIDAPVQGQTGAFGGLQKGLHGPFVQGALRIQTADDKAVGTGPAQLPDLCGHLPDLLLRIKEISGPGTHQTPDGDVTFGPDLLQQGGVGGQAANGQCAAQLQPVRTAGNGGPGRGKGIHTDFQNRVHNEILQWFG